MKKALLIIDAQKDYLANGKFPLWNISNILSNIHKKIDDALQHQTQIIFIQHISRVSAPFFVENTEGAELINELYDKTKEVSKLIQKKQGDAFIDTNLQSLLEQLEIKELDICGMMTQNCVLFTAITAVQKGFTVNILSDSCTSVSPIIHAVAINGLRNICNII